MAEKKGIEIYQGTEGEVVFDVDIQEETLWATPEQMATIFDVQRPAIVKHLSNIHKSGELDLTPTCSILEQVDGTSAKNAHTTQNRVCKEVLQVQVEGGRKVKRKVKMYNLDAIISVGYRVNSKKATQFRVWATNVLRQYLIGGVAVNERRLLSLRDREDLKKLRDVEEMMGIVRRLTTRNVLDAGEANGIIEVISKYAGSFQALKEFDDGFIDLSFMGAPKKKGRELTIAACERAVEELRKNVKGGELFGKVRNGSFQGSLAAIFQSFDGAELYPTIAEKAANLLYFIIKDHPFYDGNKRIGALLFILFLTMNDYHLTEKGETKISDRALTAIALLIAESEPAEKGLIVSLVCKLLG